MLFFRSVLVTFSMLSLHLADFYACYLRLVYSGVSNGSEVAWKNKTNLKLLFFKKKKINIIEVLISNRLCLVTIANDRREWEKNSSFTETALTFLDSFMRFWVERWNCLNVIDSFIWFWDEAFCFTFYINLMAVPSDVPCGQVEAELILRLSTSSWMVVRKIQWYYMTKK